MTSQDIDIFQSSYLSHQARKKETIEKRVGNLISSAYPWMDKYCFHNLILHRASQRIFSEGVLSGAELEFIKHSIIYAPSSCNRQAIVVKIIDKKEDIESLDNMLVGGKNWIGKANKVLLLMADMRAYKSPAEIDFMPYLDAGFIGMSACYAAEVINVGACFVNPNIRPDDQAMFHEKFNELGHKFCGAVALGKYERKARCVNKRMEIFI